MRRGLTLVETLGAIALLGALAAVSAQWVTTALRISNETSGRIDWEQAAHRTLDLIARDLAVGDLVIGSGGGEGPKALTNDNTLVITTRVAPEDDSPGGAIERVYALRETDDVKRLVCASREPRRAAGSSRPGEDNERVLLGELESFWAEIIEEEELVTLTVTLTSRHGTLTREFEL